MRIWTNYACKIDYFIPSLCVQSYTFAPNYATSMSGLVRGVLFSHGTGAPGDEMVEKPGAAISSIKTFMCADNGDYTSQHKYICKITT